MSWQKIKVSVTFDGLEPRFRKGLNIASLKFRRQLRDHKDFPSLVNYRYNSINFNKRVITFANPVLNRFPFLMYRKIQLFNQFIIVTPPKGGSKHRFNYGFDLFVVSSPPADFSTPFCIFMSGYNFLPWCGALMLQREILQIAAFQPSCTINIRGLFF